MPESDDIDYVVRTIRSYENLSYRERVAIRMIHAEGRSREEVAEHFKITPQRVGLIETQALRKVASEAESDA